MTETVMKWYNLRLNIECGQDKEYVSKKTKHKHKTKEKVDEADHETKQELAQAFHKTKKNTNKVSEAVNKTDEVA